jgi:hypothetical protein
MEITDSSKMWRVKGETTCGQYGRVGKQQMWNRPRVKEHINRTIIQSIIVPEMNHSNSALPRIVHGMLLL